MVDWTTTTFRLMYKAGTLLLGAGLSKAAGAPGILAIVTGKVTENVAVPAAGGLMVGLQIPSLVLNMHSGHALALFLALRAEGKYSEKRDQLRNIQTTMAAFQKVIKEAIETTGSAPETLPSADAAIVFDRVRYSAYLKEVDATIKDVNAYVKVLDAVLDDIEKCLVQWNTFLSALRKSQSEDKPRNVFEQLGHYSLERERDWVWYSDETGFSRSCNDLLRYRESWAKLTDLPRWGSLTRLNFAAD
jgi:hypothetical protein